MSRYLLDTNIISNATKPVPSQWLVAWMAAQADEDLFIASLTLADIRREARSWTDGFPASAAHKRYLPGGSFRSTKRPA